MRKRSILCGLILVAAIATVQGMSIADQEENAIHFYLGRIYQKLERHKHYPEVAEQRGLSGRVVLRFTVLSDGKVIDLQIRVIGDISFGEATLQALKQVGQLPPFPNEIRRRALMVEVPIVYRAGRTSDELIQEFWSRYAVEAGVDPLPWIPNPFGRMNPQCHEPVPHTRLSFATKMVESVRSRRSATELARDFECCAETIRKWVRQVASLL